MTLRAAIALTLCVVAVSTNALAQQRPLVTEDPETIGAGNVLVEGGLDFEWDIFYPLSGLHGNLVRLPVLGASIGIGSIAELQVDGGFYQRLDITRAEGGPLAYRMTFMGDSTTDLQDLVVGTKIRLASEGPGRPGVGVRLATKLPTAGTESGIGTGAMDFFASLLVGKTVQSVRLVGNVGLGALSDPVRGDRQNKALTYGVSFARAIQEGVELVGEVNGRWASAQEDAVTTDTRGALRFGGRVTRGTLRIDGGVVIGLTARDPSFGFTVGATWVFRGFTIP